MIDATADADRQAAGLPPVRLRGHHLLCVLTFVGKGYSPAFVAGMVGVVNRLSAGSAIRIVDGPDDICAAHVAEESEPHCLLPRAQARDAAALADVGALFGVDLRPGSIFVSPADWIERLRKAFVEGRIRAACAGCEWSDLCTAIATDGFPGVQLASGAKPEPSGT
ncbi:DUF1284 domain-containing protein [Chthonobacter albigriseus]|uniref:DUF1284 domain-containing protein n=1 Tax=Chthonobacter albigriseus TaxID=1683161 RepID=UPI0015EE420E|nr:DUF1284 domain-containing protein [Chthonobacter albigriseus]